MEGTLGGMDIWYCDRISGGWDKPVNLGSKINSSFEEKTPYINSNGDLYYSSNRDGGLGGFDVYGYNVKLNQNISVFSPINSIKDDTGYFVSRDGKKGCFSSNRESESYNVYEFYFALPNYENCIASKKAKNCFNFYDPTPFADNLNLGYRWDFGDGTIKEGNRQKHCYLDSGNYTIKLMAFDKMNSNMVDVVSSQNLTVDKSSEYYFQYNDSTNVSVSSSDQNESKIRNILWYYRDEMILSPSSIDYDQADVEVGNLALTAFINTGDSNYCLTDTLFGQMHLTSRDSLCFDLTKENLLSNNSLNSLKKWTSIKSEEEILLKLNHNKKNNEKEDFEWLEKQISTHLDKKVQFIEGDFLTPYIQIIVL